MKISRKSTIVLLSIIFIAMITCGISVALLRSEPTAVFAASTNTTYGFDSDSELNNFTAVYNQNDDGVDGVAESVSTHWSYNSQGGYLTSVRPGSGNTNTELFTSLVFKKYVFKNFEAEITLSFNSETWGWAGLQFRKCITSAGYIADGGFAFVQREGKATINGSNEFIGNPIEAGTVANGFNADDPFILYVKVLNKHYDVKVMSVDKATVFSSVSGNFNDDSSIKTGYLALTSVDNSHRFYAFKMTNLNDSGSPTALVANTTKEYSFDSASELNDFTSIYSEMQQSDTATEQTYTSRWTLSGGKITSTRPGSGDTNTDKSVSLLLKKYKFTNFSASIAMDFNNTGGSWGWGGLQFRKTAKATGWRKDACLAFAQQQGYSSLFGCDDLDNTIVSDETYDFDGASFTGTNYFILNIKVVGKNINISVSLNGITYTSLSYTFTKDAAVRAGYVALSSIDNSHDFYAFSITNLDNSGNPKALALENGSEEASPFEVDPDEQASPDETHEWISQTITENSQNTATYEFDSASELNDFKAIACKDEYGEGSEIAVNSKWTLSGGKVASTKLDLGGDGTGNVLSLVLKKYNFKNFRAEIVMDYNTTSGESGGSWGWGGLQFRKTNIYYGWNIKGGFAFVQEGGATTIWGSQDYIMAVQQSSNPKSFNAKSQFKLIVKVVGTTCAVETQSTNGATVYSNIMFTLDGDNPVKSGFVALTSVNNSHDFYSLKITNLDDTGKAIALEEYKEESDSPDTTDFYYNFTTMSMEEIDAAFINSYIMDSKGGGSHPLEDYWVKTETGSIVAKPKTLSSKNSAQNFVNLYFRDFKASNYEVSIVYRDTNPVGRGYIGVTKNYNSMGWRFLEDGVGAFMQRNGIATVWGKGISVSEDTSHQSSYDLTKWHTLKIRAYNGKIEFYLDNSNVFGTRTGITHNLGYLGLITSSDSLFEIKGIDFKHLDNNGAQKSYKGINLTINNKISSATAGHTKSHTLSISGTSDYRIESSDVNIAFTNGNTVYFCATGTVTISVICEQDASVKDTMTVVVS